MNRTHRGFSLIELLVYIAILSLMSVVLSVAFTALTRGRAQSIARSEVESNARFALERMTYDVSAASALLSPLLGTASSTLRVVVNGETIAYRVHAGVLERSVNGGAVEPVTDAVVLVDTSAFTRAENYNPTLGATTTAVQARMTIRSANPAAEAAYSTELQATIDLK